MMPHQPLDLTPDERRREIAKLLATALLRSHRRRPEGTSLPPESSQNCLDDLIPLTFPMIPWRR